MFKGKITGRKLLFVSALFAITLLLSCSDDSEKQKTLLDALNESVYSSNQAILRSSWNIYNSLENKLDDPHTSYIAQKWYPKAMLIKKLSNDQVSNLGQLKDYLDEKDNLKPAKIFILFNQLKKYKNDVLKIDSGMASAFNTSLIFTTQAFDSVPGTKQKFFKYFFDKLSKDEILYLLNKFENNIRIIENKLIQFCINKVGSTDGYSLYETYSAIIYQNSSYVQAGEQLEITAGMGSFSRAALPSVFINGKSIPISQTGVAIFKFSASSKPGKYNIPVEISYTDEEGLKQKITKNMEHTVAPTANK